VLEQLTSCDALVLALPGGGHIADTAPVRLANPDPFLWLSRRRD
jgi:hypothetical protein